MIRAILIVAAAACISCAAGCAPARHETADSFEAKYLTPEPPKDKVVFIVTFFQYSTDDDSIVEKAWGAVRPPDEKLASLWSANGLRIGQATGGDAKELKSLVEHNKAFKRARQEVVMSPQRPFDVVAGRRFEGTSIAYTTENETILEDVAQAQLVLKVQPVGRGDEMRVKASLSLSKSGVGAVELKGLAVTFPFVEDGIILFGPTEGPQPLRLGNALYRPGDEGEMGTAILVESRLSH
jgi:hypothetical protein